MQERRAPFNAFDNQDFREEFTKILDDKLSPLTALVAKHEEVIQRQKGGLWVLGGLWTILVASVEYLFHRHLP